MTTSPQSLEVKSWSSQSSDPWWLLVASQYIRTTITLQWSTWANVWAQNADLEQGERLRAMSRKQKPRPHYEQGPPLSPPPLWRPLGVPQCVPQCTFLYHGVYPTSVYPGVYPSVYPGKPWYTGFSAPIMKISQRISSRPGPQICLCWWRSGQNNIWSDQQSRCYSTSDLVPEIFVEKEMIPPPVLPLGDPPSVVDLLRAAQEVTVTVTSQKVTDVAFQNYSCYELLPRG